MLVQSWGGELRLLPGLPKAWPTGQIRGARARGGLSLDLAWRDGRPQSLVLRGPAGEAVRLRDGDKVSVVRLDRLGRYARRWPSTA
jgi:alpha-L-fucosidase 2